MDMNTQKKYAFSQERTSCMLKCAKGGDKYGDKRTL